MSPPLPHPVVNVARGEHLFSIFPVQPLVVGDVAEVAQLHRRLRPINALGEMLDGGAVFENRVNPVILKCVGQLAEHGEDVAKAQGQGGIDRVFDRAGVAKAKDVDVVPSLTDPLDATLALFEPRGVPGHVDIDLCAESLEIWPLARRVGRANEPDVAALDVASAGP
jgi:hypothetical protein